MSDYISRQAAIEIVKRYDKSHMVLKQRPMLAAASIVIELEELPSVQPDREKGKWINMGDYEKCSVCHRAHLKEFHTLYGKAIWIRKNFCPNCGADLRGEA